MRSVDLPTWVFHETGVGCGVDGHHADCLCDVHVDRPTPVAGGAGLLFGNIAEQTVGQVSAETIYDFAATLLGCYEMYREGIVEWVPADDPHVWSRDDTPDDLPNRAEHESFRSVTGQKTLGQLSPATVWTFRHGWTWGIPWSKIKRCVPPEMVSRKFGNKTLGRVYSERLYHPKTRGAR